MHSLKIHYNNCFSERIGDFHGLTIGEMSGATPTFGDVIEKVAMARKGGPASATRWRNLPFDNDGDPLRSTHLKAVKDAVTQVNAHFASTSPDKRCKHLVVLGIGGSALGNFALHQALKPASHNLTPCKFRTGPRLYVLDTIDPMLIADTMRYLEQKDPGLKHTCINVISKSGETAETAAQYLIFRDWMKKHLGDSFKKHIVAITDPKMGTMRDICNREGYLTLPVPDGVGGRFSVLSPVGLFSAAMEGIDIDALLDGAAAMDTRCSDENISRNPAATLAWMLIVFVRRGKPMQVMMPYSNALTGLSDWWRQLWAESLGKKLDFRKREAEEGPTPIKAVGPTDQHSQMQLYLEGKNDKVIGFLEVEKFAEDVMIPTGESAEALKYLQGRKLSDLIKAEKRATEWALTAEQRPNFTITFPEVNAYHVGEFLQLWMVTTAFAGHFMRVNAFDQPAVEMGKKATFGLLGRAGYDEWKMKAEGAGPDGSRTV